MNANSVARKVIKTVNSIVDFTVLVIILLLLVFAGYALWDSNQIHKAADSAQYAVYRPTVENQGLSFMELKAINPDAFAWLTVYGTNIDYPVVQGRDNMQYVNTSAEGRYSLAGAIFMDYRNNKYFTDFNSIVFGHNMANRTMFGELGRFAGKDVFDSLKYGRLYVDGKEYGIEFFAFVHTDAYDNSVFMPDIRGEERQQAYLDNLFAVAMHKRDIGITIHDRIILLATCSSGSTNGRNLLVGRLTDEMPQEAAAEDNVDRNGAEIVAHDSNDEISVTGPARWQLVFILIPLILIVVLIATLRSWTLKE